MANYLMTKFQSLLNPKNANRPSFLRFLTTGSFHKISDVRNNSMFADIESKVTAMRELAQDSQISTVLSYYATDCTVANSSGRIIWATSETESLAKAINAHFDRWKINNYVRDHILELATIGNLYLPTTDMYREPATSSVKLGVSLDNNTIVDEAYDIIPSTKIAPEDVVHLWYHGKPKGFLHQDDEAGVRILRSESSIIHFSLGGLLGNYKFESTDGDIYDVQFAEPLLGAAVIPTTTLNMLEDSMLLAALIRVIKFINVDCSNAEEAEVQDILQRVKDAIEQQMSINTLSGDAQSYLNPQSPNNLIYLPKVNGTDAISITDLNMAENTEADNKLLDHYENKKLSVLGVPKESLNYSSAEGLGAAGTVMSQRSALYANILERLMTAYKNGWKDALNMYFIQHNMSGFVNKFELHMNPIVTTQSTIQFEKRDAAINQAMQLLQLMKDAGVKDGDQVLGALTEILAEVFPKTGADATNWDINLEESDNGGGMSDF